MIDLPMDLRKIESVVPHFKGGRSGKRHLTAREVCELYGENPIENLIRLAHKAEKKEDYSTASGNWKEIGCYIEAKRKPIDPADSALKHKQIATLEELTKIKTAILAGTVAAIDEATIIDSQPIEHQPSRKPEDFL